MNTPKTMINNHITPKLEQKDEKSVSEKPNEATGIYVRGFVKITDPESGEIILETGN
jgi:hypothetical protein